MSMIQASNKKNITNRRVLQQLVSKQIEMQDQKV